MKEFVTMVPATEEEVAGDLIRKLEDDARPDTVSRVAALIAKGRIDGKSDDQIAAAIVGMIHEGEPLEA